MIFNLNKKSTYSNTPFLLYVEASRYIMYQKYSRTQHTHAQNSTAHHTITHTSRNQPPPTLALKTPQRCGNCTNNHREHPDPRHMKIKRRHEQAKPTQYYTRMRQPRNELVGEHQKVRNGSHTTCSQNSGKPRLHASQKRAQQKR